MNIHLKCTWKLGAYLLVATVTLLLGYTLPTAASRSGGQDGFQASMDDEAQIAAPQGTLPGGTLPGGTLPTPGPDLEVSIQGPGMIATPGSAVVYTVQYANVDPSLDATGVVVTVIVPEHATFNSAASAPTTWSCPDGAPAGSTCALNVGTLAAGAQGAATFGITVNASLPADVFSTETVASIAGDPSQGADPAPANNLASAKIALATLCNPSCHLYATTGTLTLPGGSTVPIWGYTTDPNGPAQLPGPTLVVYQGNTVTVELTNKLAENTALFFKGQSMVPDMTGVAPGGTTSYAFTPDTPGTYLYQAGLTQGGPTQTAMGMFGAILVRPTDGTGNVIPMQAYNDPATAYEHEALLILNEIDPALNADPANFDLRNFKGQYTLINGRAYPETKEIVASPGQRVLLRYVNAGLEHHTMGLLGLDQRLLGTDGSPFSHTRSVVAEILAAGQTLDTLTTVPASAPPSAHFPVYDTAMLLHNKGMSGMGGMLTFITTPPDGTGPRSALGPMAAPPTFTPASSDGTVNVLVEASLSEVDTGGDNITAAEFFVGAPGALGTGTPMVAVDGAFDSPVEAVRGEIPAAILAALPSGHHPIYVHGQDAGGAWGPFNFATLHVDNAGPSTGSLVLDPNPVGVTSTHLSGTGNDTMAGNSDIVAAEYFIDTPGVDGTGSPMTVNLNAPIASIDADIPSSVIAGLNEGTHTVWVHSQDSFGHWGPVSQIDLYVDHTGPSVIDMGLWPNPNNGQTAVNPTQPAVRLNATFTENSVVAAAFSPQGIQGVPFHLYLPSIQQRLGLTAVPQGELDNALTVSSIPAVPPGTPYVKAAEGFIDIFGPDGTGFPLTPSDGLFNNQTESAYAFIPLPTIALLSEGPHTVYVHAQDGVGNWGDPQSVTLIIDKTSPTVSNVSVTPNPTAGAVAVTLTANAADSATNIVAAEWFVDLDPGPGNGTFMNAADGLFDSGNENLTAQVNVTGLAVGEHTLGVRARDAAGNWSPVETVLLSVTTTPTTLNGEVYFSTVGGGNAAPIPGVPGPYDDADIYSWNGTTFGRLIDATNLGLPGNADVDGLTVISPDHFFVSFNRNQGVNVPGLGVVQDEDIVEYNAGTWSMFFRGASYGFDEDNGQDIDAFDIVTANNQPVLYFSTAGGGNGAQIPGVPGPYDDADIYAWDGFTFIRVFDASASGLPGNADIDALDVVTPMQFRVSFLRNAGTNVPGLGVIPDESVVEYNNGSWSLYFDGTAHGLNASDAQDLDAIWIP